LLPSDAKRCEKQLHQHFREYRLHGEWFSISAEEASEAARAACKDYTEQAEERPNDEPANRYYAKGGISLAKRAMI
jgi:hypothetical protein